MGAELRRLIRPPTSQCWRMRNRRFRGDLMAITIKPTFRRRVLRGGVQALGLLALGRIAVRPVPGKQPPPYRHPEGRQPFPAARARRTSEGARSARLLADFHGIFRLARNYWRRSMSAPLISAIPARRRPSSRRPPARHWSMSARRRRRRGQSRSSCTTTPLLPRSRS